MPISQGDRLNSAPKSKPFKQNMQASGGVKRLLTANPKRIGATIFNHSDSTLYLDFVSTVSEDDFWIALLPNALYEMLYSTGAEVFGTWETGTPTGQALIRDFLEV